MPNIDELKNTPPKVKDIEIKDHPFKVGEFDIKYSFDNHVYDHIKNKIEYDKMWADNDDYLHQMHKEGHLHQMLLEFEGFMKRASKEIEALKVEIKRLNQELEEVRNFNFLF